MKKNDKQYAFLASAVHCDSMPLSAHSSAVRQITYKKEKLRAGGILVSSSAFAMAFFVAGWSFLMQTPVLVPYLAVLFALGFTGRMGAQRAYAEKELVDQRNYVICKGKITDVKKRNIWSSFVTVSYANGTSDIFSMIGKQWHNKADVYIVLVNKEKAPWALPRIVYVKNKYFEREDKKCSKSRRK